MATMPLGRSAPSRSGYRRRSSQQFHELFDRPLHVLGNVLKTTNFLRIVFDDAGPKFSFFLELGQQGGFLQPVCLPHPAFEEVAVHSPFEMTFGRGDGNNKGGRSKLRRVFQGINHLKAPRIEGATLLE